jgi:hypothetical protein
MHSRQDAPSCGGLQNHTPTRNRPLTSSCKRRYEKPISCELCSRPFDLPTRTTSEDAASGGSCVGLNFPIAAFRGVMTRLPGACRQ